MIRGSITVSRGKDEIKCTPELVLSKGEFEDASIRHPERSEGSPNAGNEPLFRRSLVALG